MANKDQKDTTKDKDLADVDTSSDSQAVNVAEPGNPYTVSADGRGRAYDPAVDGAPGKEAKKKQQKADSQA